MANALTADARLTLQTMGGARLVAQDGGILLEGGKPLALIAYLAATPGRQARRDQLVDLLWADLDPEAAKHALRQTLWYLKKRVGEGVVVASGDVLAVGDVVAIDRDALLAAAAANDHETVIAGYGGDFLPHFAAPGGAEFEGWADVERRRLRSLFLRATESSVRDLLAKGRVREAVARATRARDADPLHQAGWRLLLEALVAGREWGQAQLEGDAFERTMQREELEVEPASRALLRAARHGERDAPPAERARHAITAELVGREREFAVLLEATAQAQQGGGGHVHLRAAAGLGKTRLLGDLLARVRSTRLRGVMVRCDMGSRELPYAVASELVLAMGRLPGARGISPESASALVAMAPALSTYFTAPHDSSTGDEALRRRGQAVAELAGALCDEQALVVLVDDVHWMDAASRALLAHLAARVTELRLLLVTAGRPALEGRLETSETRTLELPALTDAQCAELVGSIASLGPGDWAGRFVHELWRTTGGSPLLMLETLQLLRERDLLQVADGEWRAPAPDALFAVLGEGGALMRRVDALSRDERALLTLLSVAGYPMPGALLASASGLAESACAGWLAQLERRGLAARGEEGWSVAHDEIAVTVLERASAASVREAHAGIGMGLWQARPEETSAMRRAAQHLVQGGEEAALHALFGRFVIHQRSLGDGRALAQLAEDLLGRHARSGVVRGMVASLPMHVRVGLFSGPRLLAVAAAAMLTIVVSTAVAVVRAVTPAKPPMVAELLIVARGAQSNFARRVPIRAGEWVPGRSIAVTGGDDAPPVGDLFTTRTVIEHPGKPGTWLSSRSVRDSGVIDLFSEGPAGVRRLTYAKGDDLLDDLSPDGRFAVVATGRWNADSHYDLALVDLATGDYRAITSGDDSDQHARWNHSGDRLAFQRRSWTEEASYICLVNLDGSDLECPIEWKGLGQVIGWIDDDHLLVDRPADGGVELLAADVRDHRLDPLDERVRGRASLSPDGRWLACACERIGYPPGTWFVMPVGRGAEARPVALPRESAISQVTFTSIGRPPSIQQIAIDAGPAAPSVGVRHKLTAQARLGDRLIEALPRVRWRSLDPEVLEVDSLTGEAMPRAAGQARIRAAVPGLAETTRTIGVRPNVTAALMTESWDAGWSSRWWPYGEPRPVVEVRDGVRALDVNGDGSFASGAVLAMAIPLAGGVAAETRVSVRITKPQWQTIKLLLRPAVDLRRMSDEDRANGNIHFDPSRNDECGFGLPAGEGLTSASQMLAFKAGDQRLLPLPAGAKEGRWVTVRLQLFPDGRCGVAVDGVPIFLSRQRLRDAASLQLHVNGNAHETDARAREVTVWRGVPPGVEWTSFTRAVAADR